MSTVDSTLDTAAENYLEELVARLREVLEDVLVGVWLLGSGARADYIPGRSDLDVAVAISRPLARAEKEAVVERCRHDALACPAKGLELVLYVPSSAPAYELNLNGGPVAPFHVSYDAFEDEAHWFVVDLAAARDNNRALLGPPLTEVFPEPVAAAVREAVNAVLDWQESSEGTAPNSALNACRAWYFGVEGGWISKSEAAAWARDADPELVDMALALRRGEDAPRLDPTRVRALRARAREELR